MQLILPRLCISEIQKKDFQYFTELVTAPEIIDLVPHKKWSNQKINERFEEFTQYPKHAREKTPVVYGVYEKNSDELIGLCGLLTNDENQPELGYRFRKKYWGKGYATELSKHFIDYCFNTLKLDLITADVWIENIASTKVLEKFFTPVREFYNEKEACWDRRYILYND